MHFKQVVNARQYLNQLKWFVNEISSAGLQRAQFVARLGGDDEHRRVTTKGLLPISSAANRLRVRATTYRSCPTLQGTLISGRAPHRSKIPARSTTH